MDGMSTIFYSLLLQEAELTRKKERLTRNESELLRVEETIRREQQQIQEMRQRVSRVCVCVCVCVVTRGPPVLGDQDSAGKKPGIKQCSAATWRKGPAD